MTKKFIAQIGSNNTVRIYNADTGSLHKIINVDGKITSTPIITDGDLSITVINGVNTALKIYNLNSGSLKKSIPTQ
jgi:WD40 repeat protein